MRPCHSNDKHLVYLCDQASSSEEDPLAALLASLGGLGGDGELDGDSMLESMMDGLMSKEVLYEPLKELNSKVCFFLVCLFRWANDNQLIYSLVLWLELWLLTSTPRSSLRLKHP